MQKVNSRMAADPIFRRLYYVRYANNWILAFRGSWVEAVSILRRLKIFLDKELHLKLSKSKTLIIRPTSEKALFLGTHVSISKHEYFGEHGQRLKYVRGIQLDAPIELIIEKLRKEGFIEKGEGSPKMKWYSEPKDSIILLYNIILTRFLNYYSFANNYKKLSNTLEWFLKGSCLKTLAAKYGLRTIKSTLDKFGPDLKGNDKNSFVTVSYKQKKNSWNFKPYNIGFIKELSSSGLSSLLTCATGGSYYHNIRKMKDVNDKIKSQRKPS